MIRNLIIAFVVLVIFLLLIYPFTYAHAQEKEQEQEQEHRHPGKVFTGDVARFYAGWMRPDDRSQSCCNFHDCDATEARVENGRWRAFSRVQGRWIDIPATRIEREREVPPGAHLCENTSGVICFGAGGGI